MSPVSHEGGGHVPYNSLTEKSIVDNSLCAKDIQQVGGPNQSSVVEGIPLVIRKDCSAAAASINIFNADATFKFRVVDVVVECVGANGGGTLKLTNGTNDITDAMVCAVDKTIVRAGTVDDAYSTIALSGSLVAVKNDAADKGVVTITVVKIA